MDQRKLPIKYLPLEAYEDIENRLPVECECGEPFLPTQREYSSFSEDVVYYECGQCGSYGFLYVEVPARFIHSLLLKRIGVVFVIICVVYMALSFI